MNLVLVHIQFPPIVSTFSSIRILVQGLVVTVLILGRISVLKVS